MSILNLIDEDEEVAIEKAATSAAEKEFVSTLTRVAGPELEERRKQQELDEALREQSMNDRRSTVMGKLKGAVDKGAAILSPTIDSNPGKNNLEDTIDSWIFDPQSELAPLELALGTVSHGVGEAGKAAAHVFRKVKAAAMGAVAARGEEAGKFLRGLDPVQEVLIESERYLDPDLDKEMDAIEHAAALFGEFSDEGFHTLQRGAEYVDEVENMTRRAAKEAVEGLYQKFPVLENVVHPVKALQTAYAKKQIGAMDLLEQEVIDTMVNSSDNLKAGLKQVFPEIWQNVSSWDEFAREMMQRDPLAVRTLMGDEWAKAVDKIGTKARNFQKAARMTRTAKEVAKDALLPEASGPGQPKRMGQWTSPFPALHNAQGMGRDDEE